MENNTIILKGRKYKLLLWILVILTVIPPVFWGSWSYFTISCLIGILVLVAIIILTTHYYNWSAEFFLLVFLGLFFKRFHWPLAGSIMTFATALLSLVSIGNSIRFFIIFHKNKFLKWFGCLMAAIITFFMLGLVSMLMHWPGIIRQFFIPLGSSLFILSVLAFVFTLPNSNYIEWTGLERKVFFKSILVPTIFIFALITLIFVFPDSFNSIMGFDKVGLPYEYNTIEFFNLEGITTAP